MNSLRFSIVNGFGSTAGDPTALGIAERFKRGGGTVVGLVLLPYIFYPVLGFGSAQWTAPAKSA